jgi:opacity protein-like surface antigen
MKNTLSIMLSIVFLISIKNLQAQDEFSFEFRLNGSNVTSDITDADMDLGYGFEGTLAYRFLPHLAAYAGWGWNQFPTDNFIPEVKTDFEETGYTFGLQFIHPFTDINLNYIIRAGGIYNHIEIENEDGDITLDSGHGFGWQVGAGLLFQLNENLNLIPTIRFRSLLTDADLNSNNIELDLNYLSVGVGLSYIF